MLEGILPSDMPDELAEWVKDSARAEGDTIVVSPESEEYTYVVYYVGTNDAGWIQSIRTTLQNEKLSEYMAAFTENVDVQDPKGNLRYIEIRAQEAASSAAAEEESGSSETESEGSDSSEAEADGADASGEESGSSDASETGTDTEG